MVIYFSSLPNILKHLINTDEKKILCDIFLRANIKKEMFALCLYSGTIQYILKEETALQIPLKMLFLLVPFLFSFRPFLKNFLSITEIIFSFNSV